jgi:predicted RNase H-like HicB family nuclease
MAAKPSYDISRHTESPKAMPVNVNYMGFFPEHGKGFVRNSSLARNYVIIVSTSSSEIGKSLFVESSSDMQLLLGFLHRVGGAARASNQTPQTVSLAEYIHKAMLHAAYELLPDGTFYGEIPGFQGVWANAATLEACVEELRSALEDWVLLCVGDGLSVPEVDGVRFLGKEQV